MNGMFSSLFQSGSIPVLEQVVYFAQARHGVLASNIANLDTPGYRTQDLSPELFEGELRQALEARERTGDVSWGAWRGETQDPVGAVREHLPNILRHDDNNVGLEQQVMAVAKNQLQHNLALSILNSQFRQLQAAISERV